MDTPPRVGSSNLNRFQSDAFFAYVSCDAMLRRENLRKSFEFALRLTYTFKISSHSVTIQVSFMYNDLTLKLYRVTIQLVANLPLTSKQKFRSGLARPGQARPKRNFWFEVLGGFEQVEWSRCTIDRTMSWKYPTLNALYSELELCKILLDLADEGTTIPKSERLVSYTNMSSEADSLVIRL